jgi:DNA polymerase III epsilon subunit-like protein
MRTAGAGKPDRRAIEMSARKSGLGVAKGGEAVLPWPYPN